MPVEFEQEIKIPNKIVEIICLCRQISVADRGAILEIADDIFSGTRIKSFTLSLTENAAKRRGLLPNSLDINIVTGAKTTLGVTETCTDEPPHKALSQSPVATGVKT